MHEPTLINQPWLNRADTLCDDEGTPQSYLDLLSSQLCHLHPEFVHDLHAQNGNDRRRSRAAVIEYGDTATQQRAYETPERLDEYLQESAADKGTAPRRRLFLLEDLSRDYVGIIGSQLGIPPSFFGAHWADPTHSNFNYRSPFSRYTEENFVLRYASTLPVRIDACLDAHGSIFRYDANVNRHVHCYDPKGPIVDQPKSYHALSFWTSGARIDGSWDCKFSICHVYSNLELNRQPFCSLIHPYASTSCRSRMAPYFALITTLKSMPIVECTFSSPT